MRTLQSNYVVYLIQFAHVEQAKTFATVWQVKLTICANAGGCQPEHCPGNSAGLRCNQQVKACTVNGQAECEGKKVSG